MSSFYSEGTHPVPPARRGTLNVQHPPLPSEMWHKTHQVRNSEGKLEFSPELAPSAHQYSLNSSRISVPFKDPSKGLPNTCKALEGGTEAVMGSESPGFCGITLMSGPRWECARSQSAALNLPKMEQITTALLFNNGDAAWRLQIPASNAPKGARRSWAGGTGAPRWKTRPASIWSLWIGLLILFFLVLLLLLYSRLGRNSALENVWLATNHLRGKGGWCYFYS